MVNYTENRLGMHPFTSLIKIGTTIFETIRCFAAVLGFGLQFLCVKNLKKVTRKKMFGKKHFYLIKIVPGMVDTKFNNVEKNDGFDFGVFGIKMTAVAGKFRKNKNISKIRSKDRVFQEKVV